MWKYFLSHCEPLIADFSTIETRLKQEIIRVKSYLSDSHQDIMDNFDPKITRLRKKRKIILSPEASDGLSKIDSDEEPE